MTKKHFIDLANRIKWFKGIMPIEHHKVLANSMAEFCAQHNAAFNRPKFLRACGVDND